MITGNATSGMSSMINCHNRNPSFFISTTSYFSFFKSFCICFFTSSTEEILFPAQSPYIAGSV